ncbi:hypothetical protein, conserved [Eimeria praecox]|uniref:Uncharacterized protein n=1 Tax=Eimeria praecox TaxID=51316 RepID=U6H020_9EIME|nr:hypothetical protein, conserved [Eimeria praecox]
MMLLVGRLYQPFTTLGVDTPEELKQHITACQLAPLAEQYSKELAKAPLHPPSTDGQHRVQTLMKHDPHDPHDSNDPNIASSDPTGFMSLSRFFEHSAALPALLQERGDISREETAAQQQTLAAAAAAAAQAAEQAARSKGGDSKKRHQGSSSSPTPNALHLVAAEAAQTVSSASYSSQELSPAAFLDALEFVQVEAGRHYAREGVRDLSIAVAAPGEEEEEAEAEAAAAEAEAAAEPTAAAAAAAAAADTRDTLQGDSKLKGRRDWRDLLSQAESIK